MNLQNEIEELRELIVNARSMPMSASAVINRAEVLEAIDRISQGWVSAARESSELVAGRDEVVAKGEATARETIRLAELERDRLVSDTEVFRLASRKAEDAASAAADESMQLRRDADSYIEQRFANFEHSLERTLGEVRRGIANLSGRSAFSDKIEGTDGTQASGGDDVLLSGHDDR